MMILKDQQKDQHFCRLGADAGGSCALVPSPECDRINPFFWPPFLSNFKRTYFTLAKVGVVSSNLIARANLPDRIRT
jgi:hypothetical protein